MESSVDYLTRMHNAIKKDPLTYNNSCGLIAAELADRLLHEGLSPYIMTVSQKNESDYQRTIKPLLYGGTIEWNRHQVCCCNKKTYDPLLGHPVDLDDYCVQTFGEDIEMNLFLDLRNMIPIG